MGERAQLPTYISERVRKNKENRSSDITINAIHTKGRDSAVLDGLTISQPVGDNIRKIFLL